MLNNTKLHFYVASSLKNIFSVQELIQYIESNTIHSCIYDWTKEVMADDTDAVLRNKIIRRELASIAIADLVIVMFPVGRGSLIEIGYALAHNKRVIALGEQDKSCLAYELVEFIPNIYQLLDIVFDHKITSTYEINVWKELNV